MPLTSGTRLGPYEIAAPLGAGGMGEVYRARDTRLDRIVAVKVLPPHVASDPQFRERFEREARSVAALNHPHICALYDVGEAPAAAPGEGNRQFLVMELVEGETLADRLQAGALPLDDALNLARQIADALDAAHEKGILHRDLKPANIKITPDGAAKVLDFGLAKALEQTPGGSQLPNSPTLSLAGTQAGLILGTAAYMSPEQARGKAVDRRTDVWAFGCVLYEMLTARQAFGGETLTDILGAIVHREPDWAALPRETPPRIRELLRRCLQKDAKQRLRDIGEARIAIDEARAATAGASASAAGVPAVETVAGPAPLRARRTGRELAWMAIAVVMAIAASATSWQWRRAASRERPVVRLRVEISPAAPLAAIENGPAAVLSPDGSQVAYVAGTGTERRLFVRRLDRLEGTPLAGTEGASQPFFSPDGRWIGFFSGQALKKVAATGGAPLTLCTPGGGRGATWGFGDTIVFSPLATSGLFRVPAAGGTPVKLTERNEKTERSHRWPQFLPGRNAVLFMTQMMGGRFDASTIEVLDLDTRARKVVHRGGAYPRYLSSGHLVFVREATVFAVPFDLGRLEIAGEPAPVLEGVSALVAETGTGAAQFDVSNDGTLVYLSGGVSADGRTAVWVDRKGTIAPLVEERRLYYSPRVSPDGNRVALQIAGDAGVDVWVYDVTRGTMTRLTFGADFEGHPVWTPDGQRIAYTSGSPGSIFWTRADGSGSPERLTTSGNPHRPESWSPDGRTLAFTETHPETIVDIWTLPLDGDRRPRVFLQTPAVEGSPAFSPDGRWLAYTSTESGRNEVYVRPFPDTGGKWQISTDGGVFPRWTRDGRELVYRNGERMMGVAVSAAGSSLRAEKPHVLFEGQFAELAGPLGWSYDMSPDGRRFVMFKRPDTGSEAGPTHLTVVFNWFDDLRARLAPRR